MTHRTNARLFESGDFISHAGLPLKWKLECDAIHPDEWKAIAKMVMDYQDRPFYKAVGIPRGGLPFAAAMNKYASGNDRDPIMICDDVFTTGTSMLDFIKENYPDWSAGQGFLGCFQDNPSMNIPRVPSIIPMPVPTLERYKSK